VQTPPFELAVESSAQSAFVVQASPTAAASWAPTPQLVQSSAVGPEQVWQLLSQRVQLAAPALPKYPSAQTHVEATHS
jgi:hypothetical protein